MFVCDKNFECCDYKYWDKEKDIEEDAKKCGHLIEVVPKRYVKVKVDKLEVLGKNIKFPDMTGDYILDKSTMLLYKSIYTDEFVRNAGYYIEEVE